MVSVQRACVVNRVLSAVKYKSVVLHQKVNIVKNDTFEMTTKSSRGL